jgi:hypothetical protein
MLDPVTLALGLRADRRAPCRSASVGLRDLLRDGGKGERVVEIRHREAPVRDRALRIVLQDRR